MKAEYPYTPARIVDSDEPYVVYYIWHVQREKKIRKRISLVGTTRESKLEDGAKIVKEINTLLKKGWHASDEDYATEQEIAQAIGEPVRKPDKPEAISFMEAYSLYRQVKAKDLREDTTITLYDSYIKHFERFLRQRENIEDPLQTPKIKLHEITQPIANAFFDQSHQGGRYRNNMLGFFRSLFKFLINRELTLKNPFLNIETVPVDESDDHRPFTQAQAQEIRDLILKKGDDQLWLFIQFAYFLFIRPGKELRLLQIGDILENQVRVISGNGKNRKTGYVDIPRALEQTITELKLRDYPPHYYLFTVNKKPGHKPVGKNYFYKRHVEIMKELELFGFDYDLYSWKPTGAIVLYRHTKDLLRVQRHCRHSTPDQTYTYLRKYGEVFVGTDLTDFPALWE
ncbi:tyrosine-type recombinase/integrase [Rudanella paleaurantiibacter]|uniref:tyrosine-type recombinase/integrase n=1 Tax=Rudanella paleaurantiibacter TaxID=2614655 RepID=UPI001628567B|nr:hypothetical protein [Rudanella paleaurantiibacter]